MRPDGSGVTMVAVTAGDQPLPPPVGEPDSRDLGCATGGKRRTGRSCSSPSGHLAGLVDRSKHKASALRTRAEQLFERHRDRPLVDLGLRLYERDRGAAGTVVSSAVAFRLFLFFVPLLLFAVGILGFLSGHLSRADVSSTGVTGGVATQINSALSQPNATRWIAIIIGFFGIITTGRTLTKTLAAASCLAWRLPVRPKASMRATGAIVGLIVGVGLVSLLVNRIRAELGIAVAGVSFVVALAIYGVAWLLMLLTLPKATNDPSASLPGALVLALTLVGMQAISQLYLPDRFQRASQLYGAIGTTIVVLGWFFIIGRAIVFSMTLNAVIYERFGGISDFVFSLPGLRVLARRSPRLRHFFDLDPPPPDADAVQPPAPPPPQP